MSRARRRDPLVWPFALALALALALAGAACSPQARPAPAADVPNGTQLAREAAAILLQLSAYDYALAGSLGAERLRTVTPERYAAVASDSAQRITAYSSRVVAVSVNAAGPVRDALLPLADGLTDLSRDALAYADARDPAALSRVIADVTAGWDRLRRLAAALGPDDDLARVIARGSSITVSARPAQRFLVTVGPFSSGVEAEAAARRGGPGATATKESPFVVRLGPYADRAAATAAAGARVAAGDPAVVIEEIAYVFTRSGPVPDAELWREPARVIDTTARSRKIALSDNGGWVLTGSDDGWVVLFDPSGAQTAMPRLAAGVSQIALADDDRFFVAGGQSLFWFFAPAGPGDGYTSRLTSGATQLLFVRGARAWAAAAKGPTGEPSGGGGVVAGRGADGAPLAAPFPITTPAAGAQLASSDQGDLYVGTTSGGGYDIEAFRVGRDGAPHAVVRLPGLGRALAVDRGGTLGAAITDTGTYRFALADPARTLTRIGSTVRDVAFAADGTLYLMDATRLVAIDKDGNPRWSAGSLTDARRLVVGARAVVLDGADRLVAFGPDGAADDLVAGGTVQDVVVSRDGRWVGAIVDARRALLFRLP